MSVVASTRARRALSASPGVRAPGGRPTERDVQQRVAAWELLVTLRDDLHARARQALGSVAPVVEPLVPQDGDERADGREVGLDPPRRQVHEAAVWRSATEGELAHAAVPRLEEDKGCVLAGQKRVAGQHKRGHLGGQRVGVQGPRGGGSGAQGCKWVGAVLCGAFELLTEGAHDVVARLRQGR